MWLDRPGSCVRMESNFMTSLTVFLRCRRGSMVNLALVILCFIE